ARLRRTRKKGVLVIGVHLKSQPKQTLFLTMKTCLVYPLLCGNLAKNLKCCQPSPAAVECRVGFDNIHRENRLQGHISLSERAPASSHGRWYCTTSKAYASVVTG
ncbi:unnamed protein product, partial [Ectocarpus sp. 12 AP-2014]